MSDLSKVLGVGRETDLDWNRLGQSSRLFYYSALFPEWTYLGKFIRKVFIKQLLAWGIVLGAAGEQVSQTDTQTAPPTESQARSGTLPHCQATSVPGHCCR